MPLAAARIARIVSTASTRIRPRRHGSWRMPTPASMRRRFSKVADERAHLVYAFEDAIQVIVLFVVQVADIT